MSESEIVEIASAPAIFRGGCFPNPSNNHQSGWDAVMEPQECA
jgi:hypothetical protein